MFILKVGCRSVKVSAVHWDERVGPIVREAIFAIRSAKWKQVQLLRSGVEPQPRTNH
ncbi:MAG: hypothetical protein JWN74_1378 [Acidobacteriaceae bacterium]|nr:hypothetical protein [Acidobacteriaceae bacterium]